MFDTARQDFPPKDDKPVCTTCPYCGVGCGVLAGNSAAETGVAGDKAHPANQGRLCVKGSALGETLSLDGRLLHPEIEGRRASWDAALERVASEFSRAIAKHGPDSVAFYVSGQLLTEDYYVANKLMKGFIGSSNIDTNSRLCMSSSVAGHIRAFGSDTVPGCYEDLERADLVVLVGSNTAWCHPVLFQRILAAREKRPEMKIVVVDPRRTATAESADLHLALRPGSDVALFNGLFVHLADAGRVDRAFVKAHTNGLDDALATARAAGDVATACDLAPADLARFYDLFARTPKTVTVYSQGVNQSSAGTDKVNAIVNCHLITGRIGWPGMGPLSFTGQPNAMGGREVGGLANMLAAHMFFDPEAVDRVRRFWRAPNIAHKPGLKAVDLFQAVEAGKIKALWIMATNPAASLPDTNQVRAALAKCPFVVVSEAVEATDSTLNAHVKLPALAWGEKDGTVTNSERRISRQRAFLPAPGEARADWQQLADVACRMGFAEAFPYASAAEVFEEHCRLSGFENEGSRDFDISGLVGADYDAMQPIQWPVRGCGQGTARMFSDGHFFHADGRARFISVAHRAPKSVTNPDFPLILNTGRTRDQWHTMTRTGKAPRLNSHRAEPWLAMHPLDAAASGLAEGDLARVRSPLGQAVLKLVLDPGQRRGEVFAPMHWNDQFAADANIGRVIAPHVDPVSGQPELKFTAVAVEKLPVAWHAILLTRSQPRFGGAVTNWVRAAGEGHSIHRLAGTVPVADWQAVAEAMLGDDGSWLRYSDAGRGVARLAKTVGDRLEAVLFAAPAADEKSLSWLGGLFAHDEIANAERIAILAGRVPGGAASDCGPMVCSCHQVGRATILAAIAAQGLDSVEAIGAALKAGTNCGSCVPELRQILAQSPAPAVA
jgi:assimilatory nitrate reductase catalytic subunit